MRQDAATILPAPSAGVRDAEAPVRQWRVHLGAHKTATTHLQETLAAIAPVLDAGGVDFIPNAALRDRGLARAVLRPGLGAARLSFLRRGAMRRAVEQTIAPLRSGAPTVVLSEENLLGSVRMVFPPDLYPRASIAVAMLAELRHEAELSFFLSIRAFDKFLPSAYAEALKWGPPPHGGFEGVRRAAAAHPPSWFAFFERIRAVAGDVPIRIWCQEDYRAHKPAIMGALCGCDLGPLPDLPVPSWTSAPSAQAIALAEALPDDLSRSERHKRVKAAYATSTSEQVPFRPFPKAEAAVLRAAYEADLERITRAAPDALLRF